MWTESSSIDASLASLLLSSDLDDEDKRLSITTDHSLHDLRDLVWGWLKGDDVFVGVHFDYPICFSTFPLFSVPARQRSIINSEVLFANISGSCAAE